MWMGRGQNGHPGPFAAPSVALALSIASDSATVHRRVAPDVSAPVHRVNSRRAIFTRAWRNGRAGLNRPLVPCRVVLEVFGADIVCVSRSSTAKDSLCCHVRARTLRSCRVKGHRVKVGLTIGSLQNACLQCSLVSFLIFVIIIVYRTCRATCCHQIRK